MEVTHQLMRYVCAVSKQSNFHRAAQICHTSQPNISIQIKKLEAHYNFDIFIRNKRYVVPTAKGKEVIATFESVLKQLHSLEGLYAKKVPNEFRLGVFSSIAPYILPKIVKLFQTEFPNVNLIITEDFTQRLVDQAKKGQLDGVILANDDDLEQEFNTYLLFEEPFYLAVSSTHKFAQKKEVQIQDVLYERVLLLKEGHCLRDQVLEFCKRYSIKSYHPFESGSLETLKALIAIDYGVGFIPQICVKAEPGLRFLPLQTSLSTRSVSLFCLNQYLYKDFLDEISAKLGN